MFKTTATKLSAIALMIATLLAVHAPTVLGHDDEPVTPQELSDRFIPRMPGVEREMTFYYGPFTIPPGQDINRVTADVPVQGGFLTNVQANVYDVETGARPSNQDMHIHHAHWFRTSEDTTDDYYVSGGDLFGIAWVFGTGEERTKGGIEDRSSAEGPGGPQYGIYIEPGQPQALIYMLHNKNAVARTVFVALDVTFVYGSAEMIAAAPADCGPLPLEAGENCLGGEDFHHVHGKLWGNTFDVPRNFEASELGEESLFVWAPENAGSMMFTVSTDGLGIGTAGHLHPNGVDVIIANLGPAGSGCEADVDGDGYPGVTLAVSHKFEQVPGATSSEEYQMGVTQDGWRTPVRAGDRIAQLGTYLNHEYASYEAMSFAGFYVDRQQAPVAHTANCSTPEGSDGFFEASRAYLVDNGVAQPYVDMDTYRATVAETKLNDAWTGRVNHGHCGMAQDNVDTLDDDESKPCNDANKLVPATNSGRAVTEVHIADFLYVPGDHSLSGELAKPARVTKGDSLLFINEDTAIGVRHSVTSCKLPCNGAYTANYPHPDGYFDSDKMGNLDYIDGGLVTTGGSHTVLGQTYVGPGIPEGAYPQWELDTANLDAGMYSYYCRIHPWMRGWLEVASA